MPWFNDTRVCIPEIEGAYYDPLFQYLSSYNSHHGIVEASSERRVWMSYYGASFPLCTSSRLVVLLRDICRVINTAVQGGVIVDGGNS
jgi:hypothetical protein